MTTDAGMVNAIREALRESATQLSLDPASITSPSPAAIIARTAPGALIRLDVSSYQPTELSR